MTSMTESVENKDDSIAADSSSIVAGGEFVAEEDDDDDDDRDPLPRRPRSMNRRVSVYAELKFVPGAKIRLFSPPRQRQKWGSDQILPHVNWGDLFFRPVLRCRILQPGKYPGERLYPSPLGVLYFLGRFFPVLYFWFSKMMYDMLLASSHMATIYSTNSLKPWS